MPTVGSSCLKWVLEVVVREGVVCESFTWHRSVHGVQQVVAGAWGGKTASSLRDSARGGRWASDLVVVRRIRVVLRCES